MTHCIQCGAEAPLDSDGRCDFCSIESTEAEHEANNAAWSVTFGGEADEAFHEAVQSIWEHSDVDLVLSDGRRIFCRIVDASWEDRRVGYVERHEHEGTSFVGLKRYEFPTVPSADTPHVVGVHVY